MSYILDALKQSERQRSRQLPLTEITRQNKAVAQDSLPRTRHRLWSVSLVIMLALLSGYGMAKIGLKWLQPTPVNQPISAPLPPSVAPELLIENNNTWIVLDNPPVRIALDKPPALQTIAPAFPPPVTNVEQAAPAQPKVQPVPVFDPGVPNLRELPASLRTRLPDMTLSVHIYSASPAGRMASINGQMLREGQQFGPLQLQSITPRGVILSFEGQEFHLNSVGR